MLTAYFVQGVHVLGEHSVDFRAASEYQEYIRRALGDNARHGRRARQPFSVGPLATNIGQINNTFVQGSQQDAHEYFLGGDGLQDFEVHRRHAITTFLGNWATTNVHLLSASKRYNPYTIPPVTNPRA
jgi:hypothetical protein